jgi:dipeptidyl aminopeptidase/acylaminoacyl peptidase
LLIGHGANDPRVKLEQSERIVSEIRRRGGEVTFVVYPDEGHGFSRPENAMDFTARVEEFLARYLGGRSEGLGEIKGSSAEIR